MQNAYFGKLFFPVTVTGQAQSTDHYFKIAILWIPSRSSLPYRVRMI
jgi:hypothetical protein